jgi:hypothetical protein
MLNVECSRKLTWPGQFNGAKERFIDDKGLCEGTLVRGRVGAP